jgi:hypothetical protein
MLRSRNVILNLSIFLGFIAFFDEEFQAFICGLDLNISLYDVIGHLKEFQIDFL